MRRKPVVLVALCVAVTSCTVTDAESGKVLVRSRGDSALTGPSYVVIPGQMYEAEMKGTLNVYIARTRFEADKVTCYGTPYGLSCLRDPEVRP